MFYYNKGIDAVDYIASSFTGNVYVKRISKFVSNYISNKVKEIFEKYYNR